MWEVFITLFSLVFTVVIFNRSGYNKGVRDERYRNKCREEDESGEALRGYEEDEIVTDGGLLISGQYEFDLVKHGEAMENRETKSGETPQNKKPWLRKLAPLAFIDYGRAKIKNPVVGEQEVRELCSVGGGLLVELGDNLSAGIYYGWPLRGTDDTDKGDGRLNLSVIMRW